LRVGRSIARTIRFKIIVRWFTRYLHQNLAHEKGFIKMRFPSCCSRIRWACFSGWSMGDGPVESWLGKSKRSLGVRRSRSILFWVNICAVIRLLRHQKRWRST
jgi:hypothetical protein